MIEELWNKQRQRGLARAERPDIVAQLRRADSECDEQVTEHLSDWLALFDEALAFLYTLSEEADACALHADVPGIFSFAVSRALTLAIAVRRLACAGLDDAARIVCRSQLETHDIALACAADEPFGQRYIEEGGRDEQKFWSEEIGYGRINRYYDAIFDRIDLDEDRRDWYLSRRLALKAYFSRSVHGSSGSTVRSAAVPSIMRPGMLARHPFGHVSIHTPQLLWTVAEEVQLFSFLVLGLMMTEPPPACFRSQEDSGRLDTLIASHYVLGELLEQLEGEWPEFVDVED